MLLFQRAQGQENILEEYFVQSTVIKMVPVNVDCITTSQMEMESPHIKFTVEIREATSIRPNFWVLAPQVVGKLFEVGCIVT